MDSLLVRLVSSSFSPCEQQLLLWEEQLECKHSSTAASDRRSSLLRGEQFEHGKQLCLCDTKRAVLDQSDACWTRRRRRRHGSS
eukprot:4022993-Pleurochrysis_carterae.AAC.1